MPSQFLATYLKNLKVSSLERKIPNISEENAEYIKNLIRERKPKHILEIGTANGYSALQFASALDFLEIESKTGDLPPFAKGGRGDFVSETREKNPQSLPSSEAKLLQRMVLDSSFTKELTGTITTIEYAANAHLEAVEHFSKCKMKNIHAIYGDAKQIIPTLRDDFFDFLYIDAMKREYLDYLLLSLPKLTDAALIVIDDVEKFRDKMMNLYDWLAKEDIPYILEKTDADDSIMIIDAKCLLGKSPLFSRTL